MAAQYLVTADIAIEENGIAILLRRKGPQEPADCQRSWRSCSLCLSVITLDLQVDSHIQYLQAHRSTYRSYNICHYLFALHPLRAPVILWLYALSYSNPVY